MPRCSIQRLILFTLLLLATRPAELVGQSRSKRSQPVVSTRFGTPTVLTQTTSATTATTTSAPAVPNATAVSIMQRRTYLDGQDASLRPRSGLIDVSFHLLPTLTWNTVSGSGTFSSYDSPGASLRFTAGPSADFYVSRNRYALSTGVWYTVKSAGFIHPVSEAGGGLSTYNLQYLQLPLTMKLVSDNLIRTGRTFVQYGVVVDMKLAEKALDKPRNVLYQRAGEQEQFSASDLGLLLAVGYQRRISLTNSLIISLQCQRGLTDVARTQSLTSKNNLLALGAGLSF